MGKSFPNEELSVVLLRQLHRHMFAVGGRTLTDVHRYIKHTALYDTDQLALGKWRLLEMQPSEDTIVRHRFVVLNEVHLHARLLGELPRIKTLEKITAGIAEDTWLDDYNPLYFSFYDFHSI